jgi:hypothetical protein
MRWNWASIYWLCWILIGFCPMEFGALATGHPENTLSYQIWHLEGHGATFARWFVASFLLWLLIHMVFEKFR